MAAGKNNKANRKLYNTCNIKPVIAVKDIKQIQNSRYKKNADGSYTAKNKLANRCWKMQHANVITWDGLVVPCCFDKDATHQLGNLKTQSFKEILIFVLTVAKAYRYGKSKGFQLFY